MTGLDTIDVTATALRSGLFHDEAEARRITGNLVAGIPRTVPLAVRWDRPGRATMVVMTARSQTAQDGVRIVRTFLRRRRSPWRVEHTLFVLGAHHRGGAARRMLRASLEAYDGLGVARIDVHADIDVGGYVWARLGFAATMPDDVRDNLARAAGADPGSDLLREAKRVAEASDDDDLMYNLAALTVGTDRSCGKQLLAGSDWFGHANLADRRHRERIARHLAVETDAASGTIGDDERERA